MDGSHSNSKIPFRKSDISLIIFLIIALLLVNAVLNLLFGQSYKKYAKFNINNISTFVWNNGEMDKSTEQYSGLEFPKGSKKTAVFKSGFLWGAKINGEIRVGGSTYNSGLNPGKINDDGSPENRESESVRVFRVRPDYKTADLSGEALDEGKTIEEIYNQYEKDYHEWPIKDGAPYVDIDGDGIYGTEYDIVGVSGADQTLWFVANDLDTDVSKSLFGSPPLGIELQVTVWGYDSGWTTNNAVFKEYKIINKSNHEFKEMYVSIWSDIDIGNAENDYSGCDTLLNLGYSYNATDNDAVYGNLLPAVGFLLLKGPFDKSTNTNLPMTSFLLDLTDTNPLPGEYGEETLRYYNAIRGLIKTTGMSIPVPNEFGGGETKFIFSGDPVTNQGWVEGTILQPGDRINMMNCGPFEMAPGDSKTVVFVEFVAVGSDRLVAVNELKFYADKLKQTGISYPTLIKKENDIPQDYQLYQNYPNPFNPTTKIKFTIPVVTANFAVTTNTTATIKIYDVLGREVQTLYNGEITEGEHEIDFNANELPSGIYFYQLQVNGRIIDSKKMVLLK